MYLEQGWRKEVVNQSVMYIWQVGFKRDRASVRSKRQKRVTEVQEASKQVTEESHRSEQ